MNQKKDTLTYIAVRPNSQRLKHPLFRLYVRIPIRRQGNELLQSIFREKERAGKDGRALGVELIHEFGDDAEIGPSPADAEEEVGVLGGACGVGDPVGWDDCCLRK